jgi:predicted Zn-dependent peptidase
MQRLILGLFSAVLFLQSATIDRSRPPATPPIPDVKLPSREVFKLPNGLTVVVAKDSRFPLLTVRLAFLAGSKYDPQDLPGLSENVAALLNQGTTSRSARQIAEQSADLGGQIAVSSQHDDLTLAGSCLSTTAGEFLALVADVAQHASFPDEEVELQKQNGLQVLRAQRSQPDYLGREALSAALFGTHPYSHIGPTEQAIAKLDKKSLETFRDTYLVPNNAYLILVGQVPPGDQLKTLIANEFGKWQKKDLPKYDPPAFPENRKRLILVDRPGSVQANILSAQLGPNRTSPEYFPLVLGNVILGSGTDSRLFNDIREKRGYAYDAHSVYTAMQETAYANAVTQVRNDVVELAMGALNEDLAAMSASDATAREMTQAKNLYAGVFILRLERQASLADQLVTVHTIGLPANYLETFTTRIRSVEPDQVRATGKYWSPDKATVVVVGDAQKIQKSLEKYGIVELVKPAH